MRTDAKALRNTSGYDGAIVPENRERERLHSNDDILATTTTTTIETIILYQICPNGR